MTLAVGRKYIRSACLLSIGVAILSCSHHARYSSGNLRTPNSAKDLPPCALAVKSIIENEPINNLINAEESIERTLQNLSTLNMRFPEEDMRPLYEELTRLATRKDELSDKLDDRNQTAILKQTQDLVEEVNLFQIKLQNLEKSLREATEAVVAVEDKIADLIANTELMRAGHSYSSIGQWINGVYFSQEIVDFCQKSTAECTRLLKAIEKGFVGSHSGSGVLRATDVHPDFFEVKSVGGSFPHRWAGCVGENGHLNIVHYFAKRNEGATGTLAVRFKNLCK